MESSALWGGCPHRSLLAFTSVLLLCEIAVGRLCKSLINMVDSFHTLYVLMRIILQPLTIPAVAPGISILNPCPTTDAQQPTLKDPNTNPKASASSMCSEEYQYTKFRAQPFGALISSLLLASLCVSIAFEILSHLANPHFIERPLLATVLGAVSLLFNSLMMVWKGCDRTDVGAPNTINESNDEEGSTLMFCNSVTSGVLAPEQISSSHSSPSNAPPVTPNCPNPKHATSHDSTKQTQQTSNMDPETSNSEMANCTTSISHTVNQQPLRVSSYRSFMVVLQSFLGSVLILVNGLILLFKPDCSSRHWPCNLILYLDPGFSLITVVALLATAVPELWHHGLLLLQAIPEHLSIEELAAHIGRVPGVLAVHELHVWQLSDACLVASVHVHCSSELGELECSHLLVTVTEVLRGFGANHCTVQPEFLTASKAGPQVGEEMPSEPIATEQPQCSLPCQKACAKNMCCLPPEERSKTEACSVVHVQARQQNVVIENVHL